MPVLTRNRLRRHPVRMSVLARLAQQILDLVGEHEVELSLEIIGNGRMRRLNREFRGKDRPTDVLAFPLRESLGPRSSLLGDVVIALPTAAKQARALGHSLDEELVCLLTHGILHLLGYDHECGEREARRMRRKEKIVLHKVRPIPKLVTKRAVSPL